MSTDYLILTATVAAATILWRTIKDDFPKFKTFVRNLPYIGEPLSCGVCTSAWFSLVAVLFINPLSSWEPALYPPLLPIAQFFCGWFSLTAGVLITRGIIGVLLDGGAVLKHRHTSSHEIK